MITKSKDETIISEYLSYINNKEFPCVAAKAASDREHIRCMVAEHMACPADDVNILNFLYNFIDGYRASEKSFHSATIIFKEPKLNSEKMFDDLLWQRLQSISNLDAKNYNYDKRVDADPSSPDFSYSIKEEALFIIGLHPLSSRPSRRFVYPTLTFNIHAEFEKLRINGGYNKMKAIVRKRDLAASGSINPMLDDFGGSSETFQYSGRQYNKEWKCPLNISHGRH